MDNWNALMIGAMTGRAEVVRMLLDAGADMNARDAYGETALSIATQLDRTEVVDLLKGRGATE
jgi:ankyrin repeat protein